MAELAYIKDLYSKDIVPFIKGELVVSASRDSVGSNSLNGGEFLIPFIEASTESTALFRIMINGEEKLLHVKPSESWDKSSVNLSNIFFISDWDIAKASLEISYIQSCQISSRQQIEILFDYDFNEQLQARNKGKNSLPIKQIEKRLSDNYLFSFFGKKRLYIEHISHSDDMWVLGDSNTALLVAFDSDKKKYFIRKEKKKNFPKDHVAYLQHCECLEFENASFCEESASKLAFQEVISQIQSGDALLSLWNKYSEFEFQESEDLQTQIGEIAFKTLVTTPDYTRVELLPSKDQKKALRDNSEALSTASMEVAKLKQEAEDGTKKKPSFKIKKLYLHSNRVDFYDENRLLPDNGYVRISIVGDEIVKRRRERAFETLQNPDKVNPMQARLLRSIVLAIENRAEEIASSDFVTRRHEIKPVISQETARFLKEKFGIDHLTPNQEEAVRIALNTQDIAIIQGPPGTGKSTIIAAICNRLIEDAMKKNKSGIVNDKIILLSAFQNDTVEHIASKVDTLGLPTIKAGKDAVGNIRAEEDVMENMRDRIDAALHCFSPDKIQQRTSFRLMAIRDIFRKDHDYVLTRKRIEEILPAVKTVISDKLWETWTKMFPISKSSSDDKLIKVFKRIPTDAISYGDGGFEAITKLLMMKDCPLTEAERNVLNDAPFDDEVPTEEFLQQLGVIKEKYLNAAYSEENNVSSGKDLALADWLDGAIAFFREYEEKSYEDNETFMISVLMALREDLQGNTTGVRDAIKEYGQSLAATNQVAGGKEFARFNEIENVVLEEAARSNPLDLIIPMVKATSRVILVGDQKQLPQLIENQIVKKAVADIEDETKRIDEQKKFEDSLFKIFFDNLHKEGLPARCITLDEQFRMHPAIGDFISKLYYDGVLKPGMGWEAQEQKRQHGLTLSWVKDKVAVFCDVPYCEGAEEGTRGKYRPAEASRIFRLLDEINQDPASKELSIGIITFYASQVDTLFEKGMSSGYTVQNPDGNYEIAPEYRETSDHREKLRIGSVDSFQGKEFDIVILSTVRSNTLDRTDGNERQVFGFLTLFNRLNVAFSRAQKLLITVGDGKMFSDEYANTYVEGLHRFYTVFSKDPKYGNQIR